MPTVSLTSLTSPSFSNRMKPPHEDLPTTLLSLSSHQLKDSVLALFLSPSFIPFLPLFFKPVSTVTDDESRATFMFVLSVVFSFHLLTYFRVSYYPYFGVRHLMHYMMHYFGCLIFFFLIFINISTVYIYLIHFLLVFELV